MIDFRYSIFLPEFHRKVPNIENPMLTMHVTIRYFKGSQSSDEIIKTFSFLINYKRIIRSTYSNTRRARNAIRTESRFVQYRRHNRYAYHAIG